MRGGEIPLVGGDGELRPSLSNRLGPLGVRLGGGGDVERDFQFRLTGHADVLAHEPLGGGREFDFCAGSQGRGSGRLAARCWA